MIDVGSYCIHTSKWGKRGVRVIAYDGDSVVIKRISGGYYGVPESSLTKCEKVEARNAEMRATGRI